MISRRLRTAIVAAVVLGACSSASTSPEGAEPVDTEPVPSAGSATTVTPTGTTDPTDTTDPAGPTTSAAPVESGRPRSPVPDDADELVLTDDLGPEGWEDEGAWSVDVPGEASATVIDGVGVMETDLRGTHEWVRALAEDSIHQDATLYARVTPLDSSEGTVFLGMRGDGEWSDTFPYLPLVGVALEYSYSPVFEGEFVLIVLDGAERRRVGPVLGPVLVDGESAEIRFEVEGDRARAKVWRTGEDEPAEWQLEAQTATAEPGVVHIAYRDGVARSVAWDELKLLVWPTAAAG